MTFAPGRGLGDMTDPTHSPTTVTSIGVVMFTVSDVDAAIAFYTQKLGFELRADIAFGDGGDYRWVEVAPPGSTARLSLNAPMNGATPGGGGIGIETSDVRGEHARLTALGVEAPEPFDMPGTPLMFMFNDPDGNVITVVDAPAS
jgi:catechol 2,3-dioxygenase-like lactoylglutathione lyase family enzyme